MLKTVSRIIFILLALGWVSTAVAAQPLAIEQAFGFSAKVLDPNTIQLNWDMAPSYYLYRARIKVTAVQQPLTMGKYKLPAGEEKSDPTLGTYQIFHNQLQLNIPILGEQAGLVYLIVHYQGCSSEGFCYPPTAKKIILDIDDRLAISSLSIENYDHPAVTNMTNIETNGNKSSQILASHNIPWILLSFFGFGLLLAFTPCVLPMIPVLSSIIVGHGEKITTGKAFRLSLTYVLSMSLTYAGIGVVIASLGSNFQAALQTPWVIVSFATIFVALALSMLGFYNLEPPEKFEAWLRNLSNKQASGHYLGVAIMGSLATLILSPCVTAPLVGTIAFIAHTGDKLLGGVALFTLGLGMGTPLLLIGTSHGKFLPKAGMWMNSIKIIFGVMLLAIAIYLLSRILAAPITMALWAMLLIINAIYLGAFKKELASQWDKLCKGLGIVALIYGGILLLGASMGNSDPFKPLENLTINPQQIAAKKLNYLPVKTIADVENALANHPGQIAILDFYANWCTACKVMESTTFTDKKLQALLNNVLLLKANITANDAFDKALSKRFDVIAPPTFIFFNAQGQEVFKLVGEVNAETFYKETEKVLREA